MKQVEYLTGMLYSQLGLTQSIMDGSADDKKALQSPEEIQNEKDEKSRE